MDFALSEEQQFLQTTVENYLANECSLDYVRDCVENERTNDAKLRNGLSELGVFGVIVPEEFGGVGLSYLDAALISESLGAAVTPIAFTSAAVMAPTALMLAGSREQKEKWLPSIADGSALIASGLNAVIFDSHKVGELTFKRGEVSGTVTFVLEGRDADAFLLTTEDGVLVLVPDEYVEIIELKTIDRTRSIVTLEIDRSQHEILPVSIDDVHIIDEVLSAGRIMLAADTLGASQTMLDKAVAYAKERVQFNRVIGSFQAVKHMCAEMAAELEPCRSLIWYAAHSVLAIPDETYLMACHAKAHMSEVGKFVSRKSTEVHGGMGFTDLLGLHYWFKRIGLNRQLLGTPAILRDEAANIQELEGPW